MTVIVEMLAANYGDALLVHWGEGPDQRRMLVDAGLVKSSPAVIERVREVGGVDLLVLTHVDGDHIGGVIELLEQPDATELVPAIWFNAYAHLVRAADLLGPVQAERLTEQLAFLGEGEVAWNDGWPHPPDQSRGRTGGPVMRTGAPVSVELPGRATATLLSPTPTELAELEPKWAPAVRTAGLVSGESRVEEPEVRRRADMLGTRPTLEELADRRTGVDHSEANGSSIAFVFEHEGTRILLAGDAHPGVLEEGLRALSPDDGPYRLDAFKVPHHGSKKNVTASLVEAVDCPLWLVSTSAERFQHPDDEALARIVVGTRRPTLAGNYSSDRWADFVATYPPDDHGYSVDLPVAGDAGLMITFGP